MRFDAQQAWRRQGRHSLSAWIRAAVLRTVLLTTFTSASAILLPSIAAIAQQSTVNQAIDALLGDHKKYQAVITALQKAVAAHDAAGVAALVSYPIGVKIHGRETVIKSAKAFVQHYDAIVTPAIAKAITEQTYGDLFVNYQGVMFGDGEVWVNAICHDNECKNFDVKVITIQDAK